MKGWISSSTTALLIGLGGLAGPVWAKEVAEPIVAQAMVQEGAALDAEKVKQLDADAEKLLEAGKDAEAIAIVERILAWKEANLGPEHPETASSLNKMAFVSASQGFYDKAEALYQRALAINNKVLGPKHRNTAITLNDLAVLYGQRGLYAKAEVLYKQALAIREGALGPVHPDTAQSLHNLAQHFFAQGLYAKAEPLFQRSLIIHEKAFGPEHNLVALSLRTLAGLYEVQGLYVKAAPLASRVLVIDEKVLGPDHLDTATSLNNLAFLYQMQGLYTKAEPLYQRALSIRERVLGPEDPVTAVSLNNLALLYQKQGLYTRAELLHRRALASNEKVLGPDHRETATSLNNLAELYRLQGLYAKAEPLYQRALAINEKSLGPEHPDTLNKLNNLAALYVSLGLYAKAEKLDKTVLAIRERSLGPDHHDTVQSLNNLAHVFLKQGRYAEAEPLYLRGLAISQKVLGPEHPVTSTILQNLALLYDDQGLYAKAEPLLLRVLSISEKVLGPEHPDTASSLNSLAGIYFTQGLYSKAEPLQQRSLRIRETMLGPGHLLTASSLINLALLYDSQGLYAKSESLISRGLGIEFTLIQREAPYLPVADRQSYLNAFSGAAEVAFSSAQRGSSGANLALFSRLNRQGLLQEIEQRQVLLAALPGAQQSLVVSLRDVTQQLASMALTPERRQQLIGRQDELERQLYRLLPQLKPRVVEVQQVAAALPAGSALIEYQVYRPYSSTAPPDKQWGEDRYLAMVLNPDGAITPVDLGLAKPIDASIRLALKASERGHPDALEFWAKVGRSVLDPLSSATKGSSALFISPDGELNRIPFAALPAPGSRELLADVLRFRLLTTGRELLDLQGISSGKSNQALVVANPAFHRSAVAVRSPPQIVSSQQRSADLGTQQWNQLPGTAKEGRAVAQLIGGRLLTDVQASVSALQQQKHAPLVLHLATHAYYQPDLAKVERKGDQQVAATRQGFAVQGGENPLLRSGIVLAGANQPEADPDDDGYLTALEVARLNWKGAEMVVISACQSGKGDIKAGEGVYGLKRAIAVAGARSSLLSLWNVDDLATAAFMESFYSKLKAGMARADALTAAQKEFREHKILSWRHPYVWAAFQLSGDWRALRW